MIDWRRLFIRFLNEIQLDGDFELAPASFSNLKDVGRLDRSGCLCERLMELERDLFEPVVDVSAIDAAYIYRPSVGVIRWKCFVASGIVD